MMQPPITPPREPAEVSGRICERVEGPRKDQGVVNSLGHAFGVEGLPEDMRRMLAQIR